LGASSFGEIANSTGLEKSLLSKYLDVLEELGWIERLYPVGERLKPRRALHRIADSYMAFWFRYVFPNKSDLEFGNVEPVIEKLKRDYEEYLGSVFEQLFRENIWRLAAKGLLPIHPESVGRWWFRDQEIDAIALDESQASAAFFEAKWSSLNEGDARRILQMLERKAEDFRWRKEERKEYLGLIARRVSGREELSNQGYLIFELKDLLT